MRRNFNQFDASFGEKGASTNCVQSEINCVQSVAIVTEKPGERAFNPKRTALISDRKAEGKQEGRLEEEDSNIKSSSSKASQAQVKL
ncbi:hypothetical protein RhiirA4_486099 [Rhizophagus irregularis]|uniref:Uncharacterized protein n=1 Tax=Rhizophagus irregularis TaxID=588596 RepID=A0A2I1HQY8_9GLOM|nr:hypothetical protein RhiirA4_486099 [Rhizophagus irregularis]